MFTLLKVRNLYTYLFLSVIGYHKQAIVSSLYDTAITWFLWTMCDDVRFFLLSQFHFMKRLGVGSASNMMAAFQCKFVLHCIPFKF